MANDLDDPEQGTQDLDAGTATGDDSVLMEELRSKGISEETINEISRRVPQSDFSKMRAVDSANLAQMQQRVDALTGSLQKVVQGAQGQAQTQSGRSQIGIGL